MQVWGAGGSLKVTILQSSDSRAFSTVPLTPGPRAGDSTSATPTAASTPSKQALQFFCYICKAGCSSQQVPSSGWVGDLVGGWRVWGLYVMPSLPFRGAASVSTWAPKPHLWQLYLSSQNISGPAKGAGFQSWVDLVQISPDRLCEFWKVNFTFQTEALVPRFLHASEETFRTHL